MHFLYNYQVTGRAGDYSASLVTDKLHNRRHFLDVRILKTDLPLIILLYVISFPNHITDSLFLFAETRARDSISPSHTPKGKT